MVGSGEKINQIKKGFSTNELFLQFKKYASSHGFMLNPHKDTLNRLLEEFLDIRKDSGYLYCPCRKEDITGDLFRDKKLICPCAYHRKEIRENGFCKCEVFVNKLEKIPSLISTSIHRAKIDESLKNNNRLSLLFHLSDRFKGDIKIFIPDEWIVKELVIDNQPTKKYSIDENILFFHIEFSKSFGKIELNVKRTK